MTDRELLELAAKAAGLRVTWGEKYRVGDDEVDCTDLPYVLSSSPDESPAYWNPLTDDGDALRLLARLRLQLDYRSGFVGVCKAGPYLGQCPHDDDNPHDTRATRRAIVRAAAALGGNA